MTSRLPSPSERSPAEPEKLWRESAQWRVREPAGTPSAEEPGLVPPGLTRREFVKLAGAALAMAGAAGCTRAPDEPIVPYAERPPDVVPGVPAWYASAFEHAGYGIGVLVESREGRPTKVEGNPAHPASLGAAGIYAQASVMQLYDPDRLGRRRRGHRLSSVSALAAALRPGGSVADERTAVLLEPSASPLRQAILERIAAVRPDVRVYFDAPLFTREPFEGTRRAFGRPLEVHYDLEPADVVVALDADLLASMPLSLRYARQFGLRRRHDALPGNRDEALRLYAAEPAPTPTGTAADHRLRCRASDVGALLASLVAAIVPAAAPAPALDEASTRWVRAVAADLQRHRGRSVVAVGERQGADVHAMAALLNAELANIGRTVHVRPAPIGAAVDPGTSLERLLARVDRGRIDRLVVAGANPVYGAPDAFGVEQRLSRVRETIHLGFYDNETARVCGWSVPLLHWLESWGDTRSVDGTAAIVQPLVAPLVAGSTIDEVLAMLAGELRPQAHGLLLRHWQQSGMEAEAWEQALARGVLDVPAAGDVHVEADERILATLVSRVRRMSQESIEVSFAGDATVHDGRYANIAWLQELPDPVTKLAWDNAALLSPATARRLGVGDGDWLGFSAGPHELDAPALVVPGHVDGAVTLPFGYGRRGAEAIANGRGFRAARLAPAGAAAWRHDVDVQPRRALERYELATTQKHWQLHGRPILREATLSAYRSDPDVVADERDRQPSLYDPPAREGAQWGMTIDLGACTGCSACVVACQAENNVPVVGRRGVLRGREMHWLRIDRYYTGDEDAPDAASQPMLCQHCEKAPCEYVCPVNATVHSDDGLNEMIYNRCVGTRFCSNNCPYKVRRFNWFEYSASASATERMQRNPDVTVRARGVMEKCTYCVQRIRRHQVAEGAGQDNAAPAGLQTACQQACPTGAIVFGDLADPHSGVAFTRSWPRLYAVLHELGTEPRTRYAARLRNTNPDLEETS